VLNPNLYISPKPLDPVAHKDLRFSDGSRAIGCAERVNVVFITAQEFDAACKEFPILFMTAGEDALGRPQVAPVAVMGLQEGENHFIRLGKGGRAQWLGRYTPAFLRLYPFTVARVDEAHWGLCIDEDWQGWSTRKGVPLFQDDGTPSALVSEMHGAIGQLEAQTEVTRVFGERLMHFGLLEDRQINVRLPDDSEYTVAGFLSVSEERLASLSKMEISELHRNGVLHLLSLHRASLGNLTELAWRRWKASLS